MGITSPYCADRQRQPTTRRALSGRRAKWEMVGVGGFEPPASRSRTVRSSLTELHPGPFSILPWAAEGVSPAQLFRGGSSCSEKNWTPHWRSGWPSGKPREDLGSTGPADWTLLMQGFQHTSCPALICLMRFST